MILAGKLNCENGFHVWNGGDITQSQCQFALGTKIPSGGPLKIERKALGNFSLVLVVLDYQCEFGLSVIKIGPCIITRSAFETVQLIKTFLINREEFRDADTVTQHPGGLHPAGLGFV